MFESFWKQTGEKGTVVIPGWRTMSYFSDAAALCWFLEPEFAAEVRRLHRLVGNAVSGDGRHVVVGTGSTQLFQAALYALSDGGDARDPPASVVSAAPYYSVQIPNCYTINSRYNIYSVGGGGVLSHI